jgi:hypothetical protein
MEQAMRAYLKAKDHNRPAFMPQAFAADAGLTMVVKTDTIAFPPVSRGLPAITDTLVTEFGRTYEDVFTFYCSQPPPGEVEPSFTCDWLVGMREKATGAVRVGAGSYDWDFADDGPPAPAAMAGTQKRCRATSLVITVDTMVVLPAETTPVIFPWLMALPYPFCSAEQMLADAPTVESDALAPVLAFLSRSHSRL